jgi:hypothetical protein
MGSSDLRTRHTKLISTFHASTLGGHSGIQATYQRLKKLFFWQGMKQVVEFFVKQCDVCQKAKHELCKYPGLLHPLPIPQQSWSDISLDFIEGLPNSNGYSVILVIVDRFTKYSHFFPLKHPFSAVLMAQLFLDNIVKLHGVPKSIVSDRDKIFTSAFWTELFKLLNTDLKFSTIYHPQSDGQTERVNQCLEMFLHCSVQSTPKQWVKWLPLAGLWYNTSYHSSLNCTPFKALYGVDPSLGLLSSVKPSDHQDVAELLQERQGFTDLLKEQLSKAQNRMKLQADHKRTERHFQIGEQVLLKLQPYAQSLVVNRQFTKLSYKYFGPYEIIAKVGTVAYKLKFL